MRRSTKKKLRRNKYWINVVLRRKVLNTRRKSIFADDGNWGSKREKRKKKVPVDLQEVFSTVKLADTEPKRGWGKPIELILPKLSHIFPSYWSHETNVKCKEAYFLKILKPCFSKTDLFCHCCSSFVYSFFFNRTTGKLTKITIIKRFNFKCVY